MTLLLITINGAQEATLEEDLLFVLCHVFVNFLLYYRVLQYSVFKIVPLCTIYTINKQSTINLIMAALSRLSMFKGTTRDKISSLDTSPLQGPPVCTCTTSVSLP